MTRQKPISSSQATPSMARETTMSSSQATPDTPRQEQISSSQATVDKTRQTRNSQTRELRPKQTPRTNRKESTQTRAKKLPMPGLSSQAKRRSALHIGRDESDLLAPPVPACQDSTFDYNGLDSQLPDEGHELSLGGVTHADGWGRRVEGLGTPRLESESLIDSDELELNIPSQYPKYSSSDLERRTCRSRNLPSLSTVNENRTAGVELPLDGWGRRVDGLGTPHMEYESLVDSDEPELGIPSQHPKYSSSDLERALRSGVEVPLDGGRDDNNNVGDSVQSRRSDGELVQESPVGSFLRIVLGRPGIPTNSQAATGGGQQNEGPRSTSTVREGPIRRTPTRSSRRKERVHEGAEVDTPAAAVTYKRANKGPKRPRRAILDNANDGASGDNIDIQNSDIRRNSQPQNPRSGLSQGCNETSERGAHRGGGGGDHELVDDTAPHLNQNHSQRQNPRHSRNRNRLSQNCNDTQERGNAAHRGGRGGGHQLADATVDLVDQNQSGPLLNRETFSRRVPILELNEDQKRERREHDKMRKREQRAKKKAITNVTKAPCGTGSISLVAKPRLQLFKGMPYSQSHVTLVRELSKIVSKEILCFKSVRVVSTEEHQRLHELLHSKYENGSELLLEWTKRHVARLMINRRTRLRATVRAHLATQDNTEGSLPDGVSEQEMAHFVKELADPLFTAKSGKFQELSKAMVDKRGCGNPLGSGATAKINTHYILNSGKVPTIEEVKVRKKEAYVAWARKAGHSMPNVESVPAEGAPTIVNVVNATIGASEVAHEVTEGMGDDWHHPFRGPKAFFDRYVFLYQKEPTDAELSAWLNSNRPPLTLPLA